VDGVLHVALNELWIHMVIWGVGEFDRLCSSRTK